MTDQQIKVMFSTQVLRFNDMAVEMLLRRILFSDNKIDWQSAYKIAIEEMPELENYKVD